MAKQKPAKKAKISPKSKASPVKAVLSKAAKQVAKKLSSAVSVKGAVKSKAPTAKVSAKAPSKIVAKAAGKIPSSKLAEKPKVAAKKIGKEKPVKELKALKAKTISNEKPQAEKPKKVTSAVVPVKAPKLSAKEQKLAEKAAKAKGKAETVVELLVSTPAKGKEGKGKKGKDANGALLARANAKRRCREPACENDSLIVGYCRLHYIKNWRKVKRKEAILATGQLNNYVEELVNKYPDKYLDVIRQDLASEKDWSKVVIDLELENGEDELSADDEVEAVAEGGVRRDRDFDDEGDSF